MKRSVGILIIIIIGLFSLWYSLQSVCLVYINGESQPISAEIRDGVPYLSIEDIGTICLAHETVFNREQKTAEINLLEDTYLFYADKTDYVLNYANGQSVTGQLSYAPFLKGNNLYLPADALSQLFAAEIDLQEKENKLLIKFNVSYGAFAEEGNIYCHALRYGIFQEPTLGQDYLVVYYPDGHKELLAKGWHIDEIKISDGVCYFLQREYGFGERLKLYAVDLQTKKIIQLGDADFIYNRPIVAESPGFYVLGVCDDVTYDWHIEEDGIYIIALSQKALADDVVEDIDLLKQTYGIWCVDKTDGTQRLVQKIILD